MPDAFNPPPTGRATASILICKDATPQPPVSWVELFTNRDPVMSAISVFDRDCASIHIQEKNEVAFRPFGLDIPDDLAGLCIKLKEKLTLRTDARRRAARSGFSKADLERIHGCRSNPSQS